MKRVTGLGGMFFRAKDPKGLMGWYHRHLGIEPAKDYNGHTFQWRERDEEKNGSTIMGTFDQDTKYFGPSGQEFMVNFRVDDLKGLLAALKEEGVEVVDQTEDSEFGSFGWIIDPEGRRIELWEPPAGE